jgi:hypothetical protein
MGLESKITKDDIAQYQRDGAVVLKSVIDPDSLHLLEEGVEQAHAMRTDRGATVRSPEGKGETVVENYIFKRVPALGQLMNSGLLGEIAGRMLEAPSAHLVLDQIFYKNKGHIVPTPWHQDTPFLRVRGMDLIRVWIPCEFSPRDLTVQVVRGSHRWNVVYNTITEANANAPAVKSEASANAAYNYENLGDSYLPLAPDVARYKDSFDILKFDVAPGDALIFQGNMLHGTEGRDHYDSPRRAYASLWGGPNLRYHVPDGKAFPPPGELGSEKEIPNGARIGDYEKAFPAFWRAAA